MADICDNPLVDKSSTAKEVFSSNVASERVEPLGAIAQLIFPDTIQETGLEGLNICDGIDYTVLHLEKFKESNLFNEEEKSFAISAIENTISQLQKTKEWYREIDSMWSEFHKFYEIRNASEWRCIQKQDIWAALTFCYNLNSVLRDNLLNELKNIPSHDEIAERIGQLFFNSLSERVNFFTLDEYIFFSGFSAFETRHCAYTYVKKCNNGWILQEINVGAGAKVDSRSIYESKGAPGRTKFVKERDDLEKFLSSCVRLHNSLFKEQDQIEYYQHMWKRLPDASESILGSWKKCYDFLEEFQRSGNCVIKSTEIATRVSFYSGILKQNKVLEPQKLHQLFRKFAIYTRCFVLLIYFERNKTRLDRCSIAVLERCVGQLGFYIDKYIYHNQEGLDPANDAGMQKLLEGSQQLMDDVKAELSKRENVQKKYDANDRYLFSTFSSGPKTLEEISKELRENINNFIRESDIPQKNTVEFPSNWEIVEDKIKSDPNYALEQLKKLSGSIEKISRIEPVTIYRVKKVFYSLPLPNEIGINEHWFKKEFIKYFDIIISTLRNKNVSLSILFGGGEKLSEYENKIDFYGISSSGNSISPTELMNFAVKARLWTFEIVKNTDFFPDHTLKDFFSNHRLSYQLFRRFIASRWNFPSSFEDEKEQKRLFMYCVAQEKTKKAKIFDFPSVDTSEEEPTGEFLRRISNAKSQDELYTLFFWNYEIKKLSFKCDLEKLQTFWKIMCYGDFPSWRIFMTYQPFGPSDEKPYQRENVAWAETSNSVYERSLNGVGFFSKENNSTEMLSVLMEHPDVLTSWMGYPPDKDYDSTFDKWLSLFVEPAIVTEAEKEGYTKDFGRQLVKHDGNGISKIDDDEFVTPLTTNAKENPESLVESAQFLLDTAIKNFWEKQPDYIPQVRPIFSALHVQHLIYDRIIKVNSEYFSANELLNAVSTRLATLREIRERSDKDDLFSQQLIKIAENEIISELLEFERIFPDNALEGNFQNKLKEEIYYLFENAFELKGLDSVKVPNGVDNIFRRFLPTLVFHWKNYPDHARYVVQEFFKNKFGFEKEFEKIDGEDVQFSCGNDNKIDLCSLEVVKAGKKINSLVISIYNYYFERLFGSKLRNCIGDKSDFYFWDDKYGRVEYKDGKIYRIETNGKGKLEKWRYVHYASEIRLHSYFDSKEFTIWANTTTNSLEIRSYTDPKQVLYRTNEQGLLYDVRRPELFIDPLDCMCQGGIVFYGQAFTRDENLQLRDEKGEVKEIVAPRYHMHSGEELRFIVKKDRNNILQAYLKSNPNFRLVDAPWYSFIDETGLLVIDEKTQQEEQEFQGNPLEGYKDLLWFQNEKDPSIYKALLPDIDLERGQIFTPIWRVDFERNQKSEVAEISFLSNIGEYAAPKLRALTALDALRCAYIFQAQSKYKEAMELLRNFSVTHAPTDDEIRMYGRILNWFVRREDKSPMAANVVMLALNRLLLSAPTNPKVKEMLEKFIKDDYNSDYQFVTQAFLGVDLKRSDVGISPGEELIMWEIFQEIVSKNKNIQIQKRIFDLKMLLDRRNLDYFQKKIEEIRKSENEHKPIDLNQEEITIDILLRQDRILRTKFEKIDTIIFNEGIPSVDGDNREWKYQVEFLLAEKISRLGNEQLPSIFQNPETEINVQQGNFLQIGNNSAETDTKYYGKLLEENINKFNADIAVADRLMRALEADPWVKIDAIPTPEKLSDLANNVESLRKSANNNAKTAVQGALSFANPNFDNLTHHSDTWSRIKMPQIYRIYAFYVNGNIQEAMRIARRYNPYFKVGDLTGLCKHAYTYFQNINVLRHCERILTSLDKLQENYEDVSQRLENWKELLPLLRSTHFDQENGTDFDSFEVIFEYMTGIRPRRDQMEKLEFSIKNVLNQNDDCGALIQQIMGSGKTKVLLPFLIFMAISKGKEIPVLISHISQIPSVSMELPAILSEVGIRLDFVNLTYKDVNDLTQLRILKSQLENSLSEHDRVLLLSSSTFFALKAAQEAMLKEPFLHAEKIDKFDILCDILKIFKDKSIAIMDEVHITSNPKEKLVVQDSASITDCQEIPEKQVKLLTDFLFMLRDKNEQFKEVIQANQQDQLTKEKLEKILSDVLENNTFKDLNVSFNNPGKKQVCLDWILGKYDGNESALREVLSEWNSIEEIRNRDEFKLLHMICSKILPNCLKKSYLQNFGYNENGQVCPFLNFKPTRNVYQNPYEIITYFILLIQIHGFSDKAISTLVEHRGSLAKSVSTPEIPFQQTPQAIWFKKFFGYNYNLGEVLDFSQGSDPKIKPEYLEKLVGFLQKEENKNKQYQLAIEMVKIFRFYNPISYGTTPLMIDKMCHKQIGLSGTIDNQLVYSQKMRSFISPQAGSLGKIALKLIKDAKEKLSYVDTVPAVQLRTASGILTSWAGQHQDKPEDIKNLRILVDTGGLLKDQFVRETVNDIKNFIRDKRLDVTHIEYYDPKIDGMAIVALDAIDEKGNFEPKPLLNPSDRPKDIDKLFMFCDQPRSTGTDPKIKSDAVGIMTVNLFQTKKSEFLQGIMRERQFLGPQRMNLVFSSEAAREKGMAVEKTSAEKIQWLLNLIVKNESEDIAGQVLQATVLNFRELIKNYILEQLEPNRPKNIRVQIQEEFFENLRKIAKEFLEDCENFSVEDWKGVQKWNDAYELLQKSWHNQINKLATKLENTSENTLSSSLSQLKDKGESLLNEIKNLELQLHTFGSQNDGNGPLVGFENQVEIQQQNEQENEFQQQIELTNVRELQKETYDDIEYEPCYSDFLTCKGTLAWKQCIQWNFRTLQDQLVKTGGRLRSKDFYRASYALLGTEFAQHFYGSTNFFWTYTQETNLFNARAQKEAKRMLLVRNPYNPQDWRCYFLSMNDMQFIQEAKENGNMKDSFVCTVDGVPSFDKNNDKSIFDANILEKACWMAHFFNADLDYLEEHATETLQHFKELGMPAGGAEKTKFLDEQIHLFLRARSRDWVKFEEQYATCSVIKTGEKPDIAYQMLLAEYGLLPSARESDILSKIKENPEKLKKFLTDTRISKKDRGYLFWLILNESKQLPQGEKEIFQKIISGLELEDYIAFNYLPDDSRFNKDDIIDYLNKHEKEISAQLAQQCYEKWG